MTAANDCTWNVIPLPEHVPEIPKSETAFFRMDGGSPTAKNGGMFYTTNTESTITLDDVDITNAEDSEFFLKCTGKYEPERMGNNRSKWCGLSVHSH